MKNISCLKGKLNQNSNVIIDEKQNIKIRILGTEEKTLNLNEIPIIPQKDIQYTQIGNCIYITKEISNYNMLFIYFIEQELKNGKLAIKNIFSNTILKNDESIINYFFRYDEKFEKSNIQERLINIIKEIDVIIEKDYLISKIEEYLSYEMTELESITKKTTRGGKKIPEEIICNGKIYRSINQFIKENNLPHSSVWNQLKVGIKPEKILEKYKNGRTKSNLYAYMGTKMTLRELSELSGLKEQLIYQRINNLNWSVEKAIETPRLEKGKKDKRL